MNPLPRSVRQTAFEILLRIDRERSYAEILLDQALSRGGLPERDRPLLTELVYGTLRRQGTLDWLIGRFGRPVERLQRPVVVTLRLGIQQLLFLDRIPPHAAINETVELAKSVAPRAAGLVNAILRRIDRERGEIPWPSPDDLPTHLAILHGHPRWIVEGWIDQLGKEEATLCARAMAGQAPVTLRVNPLRTGRDLLMERLSREGAEGVRETRFSPAGVTVERLPPVTTLPSFREGLFTLQDESSQLAVILLDPRPGETVVDACAAPGGKATMIAEIMEDRGRVIALDRHPRRIAQVAENARRLGISSVMAEAADATLWEPPEGGVIDRILIDAPCSGLGVLRRQPEGKWWKSPGDVERLSRIQLAILSRVAPLVRPGGLVVYSTCSTSREENEGVVERFLSRHPDFSPDYPQTPLLSPFESGGGFFRSWPHRHGMDGFTAVRLRRKGE